MTVVIVIALLIGVFFLVGGGWVVCLIRKEGRR